MSEFCVICGHVGSSVEDMKSHFDNEHRNISRNTEGQNFPERKRKLKNRSMRSIENIVRKLKESKMEEMAEKESTAKTPFNEKSVKSKTKIFSCSFCPKSFLNLKPLHNHLRSKHPEEVTNPPTDETSVSANRHPPSTEDVNKIYRCKFCDQKFLSRIECETHLLIIHRVTQFENRLSTLFEEKSLSDEKVDTINDESKKIDVLEDFLIRERKLTRCQFYKSFFSSSLTRGTYCFKFTLF